MRSQSATEFLVTYGWAITIIAIVLLALYSTGLLNPSTYATQACIFPNSFVCISYFMNLSGVVTVNIQQTTSSPINITAIACTQSGSTPRLRLPLNFPYSPVFSPIGMNKTLIVQCYSNAGPVNSLFPLFFSGTLIINYNNAITNLPGTAEGTLDVRAASSSPIIFTIFTTVTSTSSTTSTSTSSTSTSSTSTSSTSTTSTYTSSSSSSTSSISSTTSSSTSTTSTAACNGGTDCDGYCCSSDEPYCCGSGVQGCKATPQSICKD